MYDFVLTRPPPSPANTTIIWLAGMARRTLAALALHMLASMRHTTAPARDRQCAPAMSDPRRLRQVADNLMC